MLALDRPSITNVAALGLAIVLSGSCSASRPEVGQPEGAETGASAPVAQQTPVVAAEAPSTVVDVPAPPPADDTPHPPTEPIRTTKPLLPQLPKAKRVTATIETGFGNLTCDLFHRKAPVTVENFVGLATGERAWKDPRSGLTSHEPAYDGTSFHRVIKGFMIQGGDPKGDGSGEPGYTIADEIWPGSRHDRPGLLCMANRGKNTNGAQFFITDAPAAHLDGGYTIFGECAPIDLVHTLASVPVTNSKPITRVAIKRIDITIE